MPKNIKSLGETIFWDINITESLIEPGSKGEAFLTIYISEAPENVIDFNHTVIIGIDLEDPDPTFTAKVHFYESKGKDVEVYKIDFTSKQIGKNKFIITLYDYESQRSKALTPVEFEIGEKKIIIEEIIPDPKKTKLINNPPLLIGENDTFTFEFSLVDTKGNDIIGNSTFLQKLNVINNNETCKKNVNVNITYSKDGKIFKVSLLPEYLPLLHIINVEFKGDNDTFNVFLDDLNVTIVLTPSPYKTLIYCENCENVTAGQFVSLDIYLYNYKNFSVNNDDYSNTFDIVIDGPLDSEKNETNHYYIEKISDDDNIYKIIANETDIFTISGVYIIKIYENNILVKDFVIFVNTKDYDLDGFILEFIDPNFDPKEAYVDTQFGMVLKGTDCYGNIVYKPLKDDINLLLIDENKTKIEYEIDFNDDKNGNLTIHITSLTLGHAQLKLIYKGKEIIKININELLPEFIFNLMKCFNSTLFKDELNSAIIGKDVNIYLQCIDKFGNLVKRGGEEFSSDNYLISNGKYTSFQVKINDLLNGKYSFNFVPKSEGNYYIKIFLDEELFIEIEFEIEKIHCKGPTPILCPNKNVCVEKRIKCIEPENDCPRETPFYCNVSSEPKCVESQLECDCPPRYIRCNYMQYCVPENRKDMCADFSNISTNICKKLKKFKYLNNDGICRLSEDLSPTQKVCPIGSVLCADLSCRDSYDDCSVSDYCEEGQIRCGDQSCVDDHTECPSTISCQGKKYVCPDGTCVNNEVECEVMPICSEDQPYRCQDNLCVKDKNSCVKNIPCGHKMALCSDLICRITCNDF